jgi:hypothetical protein
MMGTHIPTCPRRRPHLSRSVRIGLRSIMRRTACRDDAERAAFAWVERTWQWANRTKVKQ